MRRIALVVDDEPFICKTLSRLLSRHFDEVVTATNPTEAEQALAAHRVTHIVSDSNLGPDLPLGSELIAGWREAHPSIERAVVFSGTAQPKHPDKVDAVVTKPGSLLEILRALGVD